MKRDKKYYARLEQLESFVAKLSTIGFTCLEIDKDYLEIWNASNQEYMIRANPNYVGISIRKNFNKWGDSTDYELSFLPYSDDDFSVFLNCLEYVKSFKKGSYDTIDLNDYWRLCKRNLIRYAH